VSGIYSDIFDSSDLFLLQFVSDNLFAFVCGGESDEEIQNVNVGLPSALRRGKGVVI
jgi:hypothetical protein